MSVDTIRSALKTKIEAVTGVGVVGNPNLGVANVHDFLRHIKGDKSLFRSFFETTNKRIHSWQITRRSTSEISQNQNFTSLRRHSFLVFGILGVQDESTTEKTFQDIVERVSKAFRQASKQSEPLTNVHDISYTGLSGIFTVGETITGGTSGATGTVTKVVDEGLQYTHTAGFFKIGETVTGGSSSATATIQELNVVLRMDLPQVTVVEHRMFDKVLCHACDITFNVEEYINY